MNVNIMMQALGGDIAQLGQALTNADPSQDGAEFEDMLLQQSKAAAADRREEKPAEKSEGKPEAKKPQQKSSTQEEETTEKGGQLAAALVTSQPVVPLNSVDQAQVTYTEEGTAIIEPAGLELLPQEQEAGPVQMAEGNIATVIEPEAQPQELAADPQVTVEAGQVQGEDQDVQLKVQTADEQPQVEQADEPNVRQDKTDAPVQRAEAGEQAGDDSDILDVEVEAEPVFKRNTAPVKVAENYQTLAPESKEAPQQLAGAITQALDAGANTVLMQLNPANLGQLMIQISRNEAGELAIVMLPQTEKAASVLNQHSSALMSALMDRGEQVVTVEVRMPEDNQNANMFLNPDGHNQRQPEESEDERKKRRQPRTEGVNATDFLQQLRLGLVGLEQ